MKKSACYELSNCLPLCNIAEYRSQVAAILKTKMASKMWTYQLAPIKIPVERYLNYLCAKIHNFIQKCTPYYLRAPTSESVCKTRNKMALSSIIPRDFQYLHVFVLARSQLNRRPHYDQGCSICPCNSIQLK